MINLLMAIVALAGVFLNARGKWQGFLFWLVSNAWWCGYNIYMGEYVQSFLFGIFWFLSLYGIFQWRKTRRDSERQLKQAVTDATELTNKQLSILLEENTAMRNFIAGMPYHKKAKKRLRIKIPQKQNRKDEDCGR